MQGGRTQVDRLTIAAQDAVLEDGGGGRSA